MRYWQDMFLKEKKIKVLQAVARGYVARILIKRWWNRKVFLVRIVQVRTCFSYMFDKIFMLI